MRIATLLFAFMIAAGATCTAEEVAPPPGAAPAAIPLTRQVIQTERQAIVAANIDLTEAESQLFWPLYREYRAAAAGAGGRMAELISDYAKNYGNLTDLQAADLVKEMLDLQQKQVAVRGDYVKKMKKILPAKKVARFFLVESKLDAIVGCELAQEIPLVTAK